MHLLCKEVGTSSFFNTSTICSNRIKIQRETKAILGKTLRCSRMLFPSSPQLPSPCICYILTTLKQQKTFINNISCKEDIDILVNILVTDVLVHLKSNIQQSSDDILYCNITKKYVILNLFLFIIIDPQGHSNSTFSILLLLLNTIFFGV